MHRHYSRNLDRFKKSQFKTDNQTPDDLMPIEKQNDYLSESTLSSDEPTEIYLFKKDTNHNSCEEISNEIIIDTVDRPPNNGTDNFVCTICVNIFRGKVAYMEHDCLLRVLDDS